MATRSEWPGPSGARLLAWAIDWMCILVWAGVVAAVGIPLYIAGFTSALDPVTLNALGALLVVAPVTITLARWESSPKRATLGKRALRLEVVSWPADRRISFGRSLARNSLKIALPWLLGHSVAFAFASGDYDALPPWLIVLTAVSYGLPILFLASLFVGSRRTPYDRLVRTAVTRARRA